MREAVIVSTARTPIGKAYRGAFNNTDGADMGGHVVKHAVERAKIDPAEVDDVIMGTAMPEGATGNNIARQIALRAGLPCCSLSNGHARVRCAPQPHLRLHLSKRSSPCSRRCDRITDRL